MKKFILPVILTFLTTSAYADENPTKFYFGVDAQHTSLGLRTHSAIEAGSAIPISNNNYNTSAIVPSFFVGANVAKNLDVELNYSYMNTGKTTNDTGVATAQDNLEIASENKIRFQNLGLDLKPFVKFNENFKLYGIFGVNLIKAYVEDGYQAGTPPTTTGGVGPHGFGGITTSHGPYFSATDSEKKTGAGYSIGGGVEYQIVKNVAVRFQAKYTYIGMNFKNLSGVKSLNNITTIATGIVIKL